MAFSFLFNFVNVIEGSKTNNEDNREKSHNHSSSGEVVDMLYLYLKYNPNVLLYLYCGEERDKSHNQSYFSLEVLQKLRWSLLYLACGWFEGRGHYSATKYFNQIWTRGLNG